MTQQPAPPAPTPAAPPTPPAGATPPPAAPPAPPAPPTAGQPPWGKPENFDPDQAWKMIQNLRAEKGDGDGSLKTELGALRQSQETQRNALAAALGVKPEETSDADKLAEQIEALRGQILTSEKRALAVEFKVPEAMLTATDAATLRKQATDLAEFAQAAHYAAVTAQPGAQAPAFVPNPGQGQGSGLQTPEAQAAAEYEKYYPSTP